VLRTWSAVLAAAYWRALHAGGSSRALVTPAFAAVALLSPLLLPLAAEPATRVTVRVETAGGKVTSEPGGISCPPICQATFTGSTLTLTARGSGGWIFRNWGGSCSDSAGTTCTVALGGSEVDVRAGFRPRLLLHLKVSGGGKTVLSTAGVDPETGNPANRECEKTPANTGGICAVGYLRSDRVRVSSVPTTGFALSEWSRYDCEPGKPCVVALDSSDVYLWAAFSGRRLVVLVQSPVEGGGTVSSSSPAVSCPPRCVGDFAVDHSILLTAHPVAAPFVNWSPPCVRNPPVATCRLTLANDTVIAAGFGQSPLLPSGRAGERMRLRVDRGGFGTGRVTQSGRFTGNSTCPSNCNAEFLRPEMVTLTANSDDPRSHFERWRTPFCVASNPRCPLNTNDVTGLGVCFASVAPPHVIRTVNVKRGSKRVPRRVTIHFAGRATLVGAKVTLRRRARQVSLTVTSLRPSAGLVEATVPRSAGAGAYSVGMRLTDRVRCSWNVARGRLVLPS
jgi:hypothetical protein